MVLGGTVAFAAADSTPVECTIAENTLSCPLPPPLAPVTVTQTETATVTATSTVTASQTPSSTTSAPTPTTTSTSATTTTTAPPAGCTTPDDWGGCWPSASNTGAKGPLTVRNENVTVTANGSVLENVEIRGTLKIAAVDVKVRNVKVVTTNTWVVIVDSTNANLTIEDSTLIGSKDSQSSIVGGSFTGRRLDISGAGDGIKLDRGNVTLADSYIHDLASFQGAHNDGIEITNAPNTRLEHNAILNKNSQTSAVMISEFGSNPASGVVLTKNLLGGGGYTVYGGSPDTAKGHQVTDNRFTTRFFASSGYYGPRAYWRDAGNTWTGNTWADGPNKGLPVQ